MTGLDHRRGLVVSLSILWLTCAGPLTSARAGVDGGQKTLGSVSKTYGRVPVHFEANRGQTDPSVRFLSRRPGHALFVMPDEAVLVLRPPAALPTAKSGNDSAFPAPGIGKPPSVVRLQLLNAAADIRSEGVKPLPGLVNYYLGNDPQKWIRGVPTFAEVRLHNVYEGVDLLYHSNGGHLEFDLIVAAGANPQLIRLGWRGHQALTVDATGDLVVRTEAGEVRLRRPYAFQDADGTRLPIPCRYALTGSDEVGFVLGDYDTSRPLIIDPVLTYSTYLGGSAEDSAEGIALDAAGNAYITGYTDSFDFPTSGAIQPGSGGGRDVFVAKLDPAGTTLLYSTYVGGTGFDEGFGIAVDPFGNAFVTGLTSSVNFPVTEGSFQPSIGAGACGAFPCADGFVLKLDPQGTALLYSTYLGGSGDDEAFGIAVDAAGNAHVTGQTASTNFPTMNPFQANCQQCAQFNPDAFFAKLNAAGSALLYSTFLGGSSSEAGRGIALDPTGNAYISGQTASPDFPTRFPLQPHLGGGADAFVAKFDAASHDLVYATYLGGTGLEGGNGVAADPSGNAFVTGFTASFNFPTRNGFQPFFAGGFDDAFVTKIGPAGELVFSSFLGGNGDDGGFRIVLGPGDTVVVAGSTMSSNFPVANPLQPTCNLHPFGICLVDAFVTILDTAGTFLTFSSYLGGSNLDTANGVAVDSTGSVLVVGRTFSVDFPTIAALQPTLASPPTLGSPGQPDAFVARLDVTAPNLPPFASTGFFQFAECGAAVLLDGSGSFDPDGDPLGFVWLDVNGLVVGTTAQSAVTLPAGFHAFALTVSDGKGATATATVFVVVQDTTPPVLTLSRSEIVHFVPAGTTTGAEVDLAGVASASDLCDPSPFVINDAPTLFPLGTTTVTFTAIDAAGNTAHGQVTVIVRAVVELFLRASGPLANPSTLFLDTVEPTAATPRYKDSPAVAFGSGNPWREVGTWVAAPALSSGTLERLDSLHAWLGLKNSDDQGTQFDLRVEVLQNGTPIASGETRCITGVTRNPALAREAVVSLSFDPPDAGPFNGTTDTLALRVVARIGTNPDGSKCAGPGGSHSNAVGLRLYFDAANRASMFGAGFVD